MKFLKVFLSILLILFPVILFYGCSDDPVVQNNQNFETDKRTFNYIPNKFYGNETGFPKLCPAGPQRLELWAGAGNPNAAILVGYVEFTIVTATSMRVRYLFNDLDNNGIPDMFPWVVKSVHFDIGNSLSDIPVNNSGNPVPGQFDYKVDLDSPWTSTIVEFDVALPPDPEGDGYFVAAHAATCYLGGIEGFNFYLPNNAQVRVTDYPSAGDPTYFKIKVTNGGFISDYDGGYGAGIYEGWCIDVDRTIALNTLYNACLFSSYEELPSWLIGPGKIEYPENLDKVNWIVNNFQSGQVVQPLNADCTPYGVPSELTYSDIQRAIWFLMDDGQSTSGLINWSQYRVNTILCAANSNGEGFIPGCNQKVVFLMVPNCSTFNVQVVIGQPVIGQFQVPCVTQCETAWGDGKLGANFPNARQWGTYFIWDDICP